jgi:3-oxoacyl-[acyl-carrier-protein] synthase II
MGCITPLGHSVDQLFESQLAGRSGVGPIQHFNASRFPTKFASQVKDFDLNRYVSDPKRWVHAGSNSRFAAGAAQQALTDAGLIHDSKVDRTRFGVYVGAGEGIQDFHHFVSLVGRTYEPSSRVVDAAAFIEGGLREFHPGREFEQELHTTAAHLAGHFNLEGPNYTCLTACAASSQAIGEAAWLIRQGDADLMGSTC